MIELKRVYLANPRGFCAGVKYAISYVNEVQNSVANESVFVRKEIVHNKRVVEDMKKKGIQFVNELDEVPEGSTVIFSAHGVSPEIMEKAKEKNLKVGDATCPLVTRVHRKARKLKGDFQIIYIGHKGHDEAIGTMGEAEMFLVETVGDVEQLKRILNPDKPITYLMQTTLSVIDTGIIVDKIHEVFPDVIAPDKGDICYATTQRQDAVGKMLDEVDAMMVIGSENSSNSMRLYQLALKRKPESFLLSSADDITKNLFEKRKIEILGVTAGASSPQILLEEIIERIRSIYPNVQVEDFPDSIPDGMNFKLPGNLIQ